MSRSQSGFTLIELMIVVVVMAMIFAIAVPTFVSARVSSNENAAIATLRTIASAQAQVMSQAAIDCDADGSGEAGYFGELSGLTAIRVYSAAGPVPGPPTAMLDPDLLPTKFGGMTSDGTHGIVQRQGYYYKMWLPDGSDFAPIGAVGEDPAGGATAGSMPGSANAEIMWCCYAWPVQRGKTGNRAFFIDAGGEVVSTQNTTTQLGGAYTGTTRVPAFDAAFSIAGDMSSVIATATSGLTSQDQLVWSPVGN